jgi:hypothetical protein
MGLLVFIAVENTVHAQLAHRRGGSAIQHCKCEQNLPTVKAMMVCYYENQGNQIFVPTPHPKTQQPIVTEVEPPHLRAN